MSDVVFHIIVRGMVQGVGYRAFVEDEAAMRGLEGWVRNRGDGSVEAVIAGPAEEVALMIEGCRKGPWSARVDAVDEKHSTRDLLAQRRLGEKFSVLTTI